MRSRHNEDVMGMVFKSGVLLGISALIAKFLGLFRDRLIVETFSVEQADIIFAAFRIPDFFYFLLVGATISVLFVPRYLELSSEKQNQYFSSFFWAVAVFFGGVTLAGVIGAPLIAEIFAPGFSEEAKEQIAMLMRWLFLSVFLLALSSVSASALQAKERFLSMAVTPIIYTLSIVGGLMIYENRLGIAIIGISAVIGACAHFLLNFLMYLSAKGRLLLCWRKPLEAWKAWKGDFFRRIGNSVLFQINQTIDIWIASFLVAGSVMAFALGSALGHFLLSIVGFSIANAAFPKLVSHHKHPKKLQNLIQTSTKWILAICIPVGIFCALFSKAIIKIVFDLPEPQLEMSAMVFLWTVISLPFACLIPLYSRVFLAHKDTKTPFLVNLLSLSLATSVAIIFSLFVFSGPQAILGLAWGNFTANTTSAGLLGWILWKRYFETS